MPLDAPIQPHNRTPADVNAWCSHCQASNPNPRQVSLWLVHDERGPPYECDNCGVATNVGPPAPPVDGGRDSS